MYHPLFTIVLHAAIIIHIIYIVRDVIIAHVISADAQIYTRLVYYVASPRSIPDRPYVIGLNLPHMINIQ